MIDDFSKIYNNYDLFLIDIWGVVHDGYTPYPGTIAIINKLLKEKELFFVSNAPRPNHAIATHLQAHGLNVDKSHVVTSGDVTRAYLLSDAMRGKIIYHLEAEKNTDILADLNVLTTTDLNLADVLLMTVYIQAADDINKFDKILKQAAELGIPAICANPDKEVISGESSVFCAGVFAAKFTDFGGKVIYIGKPHQNIYDFALKKMTKLVPNERILMIGDTIDTDVLGAFNAGIHCALVMTGNVELNFRKQQITDSSAQVTILNELLKAGEHKPTYYIKGLF